MKTLVVKPENGRVTFPRFTSVFDNFFDNFEKDLPTLFEPMEYMKTPALANVKETKDGFEIALAVPGFSKEDISIKVENNILYIAGETKQEQNDENERFTRREYNYSKFNRSFSLPKTVVAEKIAGNYENGILKLVLPKAEEAKKKEAIEVKLS